MGSKEQINRRLRLTDTMTTTLRSTNPQEQFSVLSAAQERFGDARRLQVDYEHGQWWVTILRSGAQYSVVDATGPGTYDDFGFELVTVGDDA